MVGTAVVGSAVNVITEIGETELMIPGSALESPEDTELESPDVETDEASPLDTAVLDTRYSVVEDRRADRRVVAAAGLTLNTKPTRFSKQPET